MADSAYLNYTDQKIIPTKKPNTNSQYFCHLKQKENGKAIKNSYIIKFIIILISLILIMFR